MTTLKRVRTTQPQGACAIDWRNDLSKGLVSFGTALNGTPYDFVVKQRLLKNNTAAVGPSSEGIAAISSTDLTDHWYLNYPYIASSTPAITLFVWAYSTTTVDVKRALRLFVPGNSTASQITFGDSFYSRVYADVSVVGGAVSCPGTIGAVVANKPTLIVFTQSLSSYALWVDRARQNYGASTGTNVLGGITGITIAGGGTFSGKGTSLKGGVICWGVWTRAISDTEIKSLSDNPWQIFAPISQPIFVGTVAEVISITRPSSDVSTSGWTGTPDNTNLYTNINETVASDTSYITSPIISGVHECIEGISPTLDAGTWDITYRANFVGASAQVRVSLLDAANTPQGVSDWQTVTSTFATYTAVVVTTGAAVRVKIEVQ